MASIQTLKLLDALLSGSSGTETEKLKELYKAAYTGTECFKELKTLLERSEFHGATGRELLTNSEKVIQSGFTDAGSFGDNIITMEYLVDKIRRELEESETYIRSATVAEFSMGVVDKRLADDATAYYETLFHYVCYLYASLYGAEVLRNFNVATGIRSIDLVRNMNSELGSLLEVAQRMKKPKAWRILRRSFRGKNLIPYDGFVLKYGQLDQEYLGEHCRQVTPTLYVPKENGEVLCCGLGYLTNLDIATGGKAYGTRVTTEPALDCLDGMELRYNDLSISTLMQRIAGSGVCITTPEQIVEVLNRYFMTERVRANQGNNACSLCGKNGCRHFHISFPKDLSAPMARIPAILP